MAHRRLHTSPLKIAIVLPRNMSFGPARATSIDLCVRDFVGASRFRATTAIFGEPIQQPFPGFDYRAVERGRAGQVAYARGLADAAGRWRPDVVVVQQHPQTAALIAGRLAPVPVVLHRHGLVRDYQGLLRRWRYRQIYGRLAHVVWVTQALADGFRQTFPALADRASAVVNGVDLDLWRPEAKAALIAYAGRAAPEKGVLELADALRAALPRFPEWRASFAVAVSNADRATADAVLERLRPVMDQISWRENAPQDAVRSLLARASISVTPSIVREGFNRVAMESHAAGAALISSGSGGLREVSGDAALILSEVSAAAIEGALTELMGDAARLASWQARSRARAEATLDLRAAAAKLDDVYERARFPLTRHLRGALSRKGREALSFSRSREKVARSAE